MHILSKVSSKQHFLKEAQFLPPIFRKFQKKRETIEITTSCKGVSNKFWLHPKENNDLVLYNIMRTIKNIYGNSFTKHENKTIWLTLVWQCHVYISNIKTNSFKLQVTRCALIHLHMKEFDWSTKAKALRHTFEIHPQTQFDHSISASRAGSQCTKNTI